MNILSYFKKIRAFVFDMDGVLTDGRIFVFDSGEQVRSMSIKDGYALQLAIKQGYSVLVVSGADSTAVRLRLQKLGITDVLMKVQDKKETVAAYAREHHLPWEEILFMGDDIPDQEVMQLAGLSCAPADAAPEIKQAANYISPWKGGEGCVRDVIEKVLKLNGKWSTDTTIASR